MAGIKIKAAANNGSAEIAGPPDSSANTVLKLPADTGSAGKVLKIKSANHSATNAELEWAADSGKILQVLSSHKVNSFATTSSSFVDVTDISRTIDPIAASSKIYIVISLHFGGAAGSYPGFNLLRGSTIVTQGTNGTGVMTNCTWGDYVDHQSKTYSTAYNFLDSPSYSVGDTLTYKLQIASLYASKEVCINRANSGTNATYVMNGTSTITVMEVGA